MVALTFDDGPDPIYTPQLLDELRSLDVPATFFCVGERVAESPALVRRMIAEGHRVGSHGERHADLPTLSFGALVADLRAGHRTLETHLAQGSRLYRPAHGDLAARTAITARIHGLRTWLWTVDPEDYRPGVTAEELAARCAGLEDGDVVVMHDGLEQPESPSASDRSATVASIRPIVEQARAKGLEFVGLPA